VTPFNVFFMNTVHHLQLLAGSAFGQASTDPRFSGITAEADAWVLAFRHKTAAHSGGSMWPRNQWS
jgi:hypothetical protein